ncbi:MAG: pyroglutamyl-peptidase I family protein [Candidatus Poseidoniales archaeon]
MVKPILVTGFEPFGVHRTNISQEVALKVAELEVRGHQIKTQILSVDLAGSKRIAQRLENENFAAIIHLGLAENAEAARIEMRAKDILDFRIADNSGRQIKDSLITGDGDLSSTIRIDDWDISTMIGQPVVSEDAGEFLCNEVLHRTLHALRDETPCFFLHLPPHCENPVGLVLQCLDRMLRPPCLDVGAGAIIRDGKFLAARRAPKEKHAGWWEFPGGKFEPGEDAIACLKREIREELELEVEVGEEIGIWIYDHGDVVVRLHVRRCTIISGNMVLNNHDKVHWCTKDDEVEWLGPDQEIASTILTRIVK